MKTKIGWYSSIATKGLKVLISDQNNNFSPTGSGVVGKRTVRVRELALAIYYSHFHRFISPLSLIDPAKEIEILEYKPGKIHFRFNKCSWPE